MRTLKVADTKIQCNHCIWNGIQCGMNPIFCINVSLNSLVIWWKQTQWIFKKIIRVSVSINL